MRKPRDYTRAFSINESDLKVTLVGVKDQRSDAHVRFGEAVDLIFELLRLSTLRGRPRKSNDQDEFDVAA